MLHREYLPLFFLALPLLASCGGGPSGGPDRLGPAPPEVELPTVAGRYQGIFEISGEPLRATLDLRQDEYRLTARLLTLGGMEAVGAGILEPDSLVLDLSYETSCPGRLRLAGRPIEGGGLKGALTAEDCTGSARGGFRMAPVPDVGAPDEERR